MMDEELQGRLDQITGLLQADLTFKLRSYVAEILGALTETERATVRKMLLDKVTIDSVTTTRVKEWLVCLIDAIFKKATPSLSIQLEKLVGEKIAQMMPEIIEAEIKRRAPNLTAEIIHVAIRNHLRNLK